MTNGWGNQPNDHIIRTMQELSDSVKKLTHSVENMSKSGGSSRVPKKGADDKGWKDLKDTFEGVIRETLPKKKDGQLYKSFDNKIDSILKKYENAFKEIYNITEFGYNRDNPSNRVNAFNTDASLDLLNKILSEFNGARGFQNNTQQNRQALLQGHDLALVKDTYRYQPAEGNNHEAIVRYTGTLSQVRDAVVTQTAVLNNIHQALTNNNSAQSSTNPTQVNNNLNAIAANSQLVRDALKSLEKSVNKSTSAVDKFYDKIKTTATNLTTINRRLSGSATSLQNIGKKLSGVSKSLNGTQKKLGAIGSASASSKNNSFREQATRNSDRAKQAGFIALLIPALAKLLKKSPMTDLLKLLFLRLGATHPMLAAAGLMASPFITGTILAPAAQRMLSGIFGIGGHLRGTRNVRVPGVRSRIPLSQTFKYTQGAFAGVTHADNTKMYSIVHRRHLELAEPIIDPSTGRELRDASGLLRLRGKTENIAGNLGYLQGRQWARNMRRLWNPKLLPLQLGRSFAGMSKRIPLLGTALSALFEVPDLLKAKRTGNKDVMHSQIAKSVGGVSGGLVGSALGGTLGGLTGPLAPIMVPLGATIGGVLGDKIGRHLGKLTDTTISKAKQDADAWKDYTGWRTGFGSRIIDVVSGIASTLSTLLGPVQWLAEHFGFSRQVENKNANDFYKDIKDRIRTEKIKEKVTGAKLSIDEAIYKNALDYKTKGDKGLLNAKKIAYDNLMDKFAEEYVHSKIGKAAGGNTADVGSVWAYRQKHAKEIEYYQKKRWDSYVKNEPTRIGSAKESLKNVSTATLQSAKNRVVKKGNKLFVDGYMVTSGYGGRKDPFGKGHEFHEGIDLATPAGTPLKAWTSGKVVQAGFLPDGYGTSVVVENKDPKTGKMRYVRYSHMKSTPLKVGQHLNANQFIGLSGNSGKSTGDHTHTGVHYGNKYSHQTANPLTLLGESASNAIQEEYNSYTGTKTASNKKAITETAELGSGIREAFRELVGGGKGGSSKQDRTRNIVLSAVDVTGSLGVWGITQYNNGVMSK